MRLRAHLPDGGRLLAAEQVVARHLAPTPLVDLAGWGGRVQLKVEAIQPTGSFKIRGAPRRCPRWRPTDPS